MKKGLSTIILALMLGALMLAGCAAPAATQSPAASAVASVAPSASAEAPTASAEATPEPPKADLPLADKVVQVTLFYAFGGNGAPKGDQPIWQKVKEITNVELVNVANESISDDLQSLNTMLASGEKLPDLIQGQRTNINPVVSQGAFIPLDDLIAQNAPNIQKFLQDYPVALRAGKGADGKLYTLTGTLGAAPGKAAPSMGFFIRQDWLDKLGLKAPTTLQEYKDVLYAFREKDPNGNSKKDEIPFFYRDKGIWTLLQLWDAASEWAARDGKVYRGRSEAQYKAALTELSQWYADGIIDPEIFTRGSQARQTLLGTDVGGATMDWFASTGAMNDTVKEQVPTINFVAFAPPADVNGKVKQVASREPIHAYSWGISVDCKDPVLVSKFMNWIMSEEATVLMNYGIEGQHYDMVDGKPVPNQAALTNPAGFPNFLRSIGSYEIGKYGDLNAELITMNKQAREGFEMYAQSDWVQEPFPALIFTAEEQKVIDDNMPNIRAKEDEYEQQCLLGDQSVADTWDAHIKALEGMNLRQVEAAYTAAYARYLAGD